jgi:uncharacterized protein
MVVDCHVHLNNYHPSDRPTVEANLERLRSQIKKWDLEACVVLSSYRVSEDRPAVERIIQLIDGDPRLPIVEGLGITTGIPPDWQRLEEHLAKGKVKGLKLYPGYEHLYPHSREFQPAMELAGKYKVPIMVHTGDTFNVRAKLKYAHPLEMDEVCVDYPDINFILCHMGSPWFRTTAEVLYKNPNAYGDISGLTLEEFDSKMEEWVRKELAEVILYSGEPDKILYGTDWPLVRMGPYLRFVQALDLEPAEREALLRGNAARLFKIPLERLPPEENAADAIPRNLRAPRPSEEESAEK